MTLNSLSEAASKAIATMRKTPTSTDAISVERANKAAARLLEASPAANDKSVISAIEAAIGQKLVIKSNSLFSESDPELNAVIIDSVKRPPMITNEALARIKTIITLSIVPASEKTLTNELARLRTITAGRADDRAELAAKAAIYLSELPAYPADVAIEALRHPWKWFPAWGELQAILERLSQPRKALYRAISSWKPWTVADERKRLEEAIEKATFDAKFYAWRDPGRAEKAIASISTMKAKMDKISSLDADFPCQDDEKGS